MATASKTQFGLEDYIGHGFHPDCDFVDGQLEKRNLGELEHSEMQAWVCAWLVAHAREWAIKPLSEMRVQVSESRYRVADVAVIEASAPREKILITPPLLVIEVLSPEDRISRYRVRLGDYRSMGVKHIWMIDPGYEEDAPALYDCSSGDWILTDRLEVSGTPIYLKLEELPKL